MSYLCPIRPTSPAGTDTAWRGAVYCAEDYASTRYEECDVDWRRGPDGSVESARPACRTCATAVVVDAARPWEMPNAFVKFSPDSQPRVLHPVDHRFRPATPRATSSRCGACVSRHRPRKGFGLEWLIYIERMDTVNARPRPSLGSACA